MFWKQSEYYIVNQKLHEGEQKRVAVGLYEGKNAKDISEGD